MRSFVVFILTALLAATGFSGVVNQIGTYNNWATSWTAISGGNDSSNAVDQTLDFVGNASSPGLYYANNGSYAMFRMRVNADTFTTASGAHILLIDIANYGVTGIDYAFSWDSKSNINANHGLEMSVHAVNGPTWGISQVDDMDGSDGQKLFNDINGSGRATDGYVRTTDGQSTVAFGNTTFIDFAVAWSYLETYTNLRSNQTWSVGLASIANATDHNVFNADVGGGVNDIATSSISTGWTAIPEPATALLLALGGGLTWLIRLKQRW